MLVARLQADGLPITRLSVSEVHPRKTYIPRHSSPQQGRFRLQCPLVVPPGSVSRLIFRGHHEISYGAGLEGKCFWFDESFEHELEYRGNMPRASLLLDVPHPALLAELRRAQAADDSAAPGFALELEAPSMPRHWELLWAPMTALAREVGVEGRLTVGQ